MKSRFLALLFLLCLPLHLHAVELKISAQALEHTLKVQLFNGPNGRYYIKGGSNSACYVYADARIERLSESRELNFVLMPFLSHKVPSSMKVNAADLLRKVLAQSLQSTGYDLKLDRLKIHSMQVEGDALVVDVDGDLSVN